jgi:hypothetical protein
MGDNGDAFVTRLRTVCDEDVSVGRRVVSYKECNGSDSKGVGRWDSQR